MTGTGFFLLLPASLSQFGSISIIGWIITLFGAISLALVFVPLSKKNLKRGVYLY